jgi:IS30 family transposase
MGGRRVPAEKVAVLLEGLDAGLNPLRAAAVAGVSKTFAYQVDRGRPGGAAGRLAGLRAGMAVRAGARAGRARDRAERERRVLGLLGAGLNPGQAAAEAGVSKTYAYDLRQKMGGVCRPPGTQYSGRYLSREERYEIARLLALRDAAGRPLSRREVARRIGRDASAVCRELQRNSDPVTGAYQPERADRLAWERQRRPKASKLAGNRVLREAVQGLLDRRHSPRQVSGRLRMLHPGDPSMQVSHETIYQSIYLYPRGELKKELRACLRSGRARRRPRGRGPQSRGRIVGAVPVGQRPPEAEGRLVPGHHEGDLVMGSAASNSAVATVVERMTGYLTLIHLPDGHTADAVATAVTRRLLEMPAWFARTLTWDNGKEMARHARITEQTGVAVYFADPYAPWQRGSNENTNGLLREYLPKGTDLSLATPEQLQAIEDELNDRPRERHGFYTPREMLAKLTTQQHDDSVATTT